MIVGIGSDLIAIARIQHLLNRFPDRFFTRVFSKEEQEFSLLKKNRAAFLAKRFAAKEALLKALGIGMRSGITWHDMTIRNNDLGQPYFVLSGKTREHFRMLGGTHIHLSLSDTDDLAQAFVVIESCKERGR